VTSRKETLDLPPTTWTAAVRRAATLGARLPLRSGESIDDLLRRHDAMLFDPRIGRTVTVKSPSEAAIRFRNRRGTYYGDGVTMSTFDIDEKHALNSDVEIGLDGAPIEIPWRAGDPSRDIPPGATPRNSRRSCAISKTLCPTRNPRPVVRSKR
jgi:hypothetical protein